MSDETSDPKGRLVGLHVTCGVARAKEAEDAGADADARPGPERSAPVEARSRERDRVVTPMRAPAPTRIRASPSAAPSDETRREVVLHRIGPEKRTVSSSTTNLIITGRSNNTRARRGEGKTLIAARAWGDG